MVHLADGLRYHLGRQNAYRVLCTCNLLLAYVFFTLAGGQVMEVEVYPGVSRWKLIPNLWMHKTVNVTCPGTAVRLSSSLKLTHHPCPAAISPRSVLKLRPN